MRKVISEKELDVLQSMATKGGKVDYDKFAKMIEISLLDKDDYKKRSAEVDELLKSIF